MGLQLSQFDCFLPFSLITMRKLFLLALLWPTHLWSQTQSVTLQIGTPSENSVNCPSPLVKVSGSNGNASAYTWTCNRCSFYDVDGTSLGAQAFNKSEFYVSGSGSVSVTLSGGGSNTFATTRNFFIATGSSPSPRRLGYQYSGGTTDPAPANHIGTIPYDASSFTLLIPAADLDRGDGTPIYSVSISGSASAGMVNLWPARAGEYPR